MNQVDKKSIETLIERAGFSSTYERVRLERLIWLTALEISSYLSEEDWTKIKEHLFIPNDVQQRKNLNYIQKTTLQQEETYSK